MSLIDLLDHEIIWQEFLEYKKNSHLPNKIIAQYEEFINQKKYKNIAKQIKEGTYIFSIPKKIIISKMGSQKKRVVYRYQEEETYILKLISCMLYRYDYLFSDNLYSFRKQRGVKQAIYDLTKKYHLNSLYGYKVDIKNYFNSIDIQVLLEHLEKDLQDQKLFSLFEMLLKNNKIEYQNIVIEEKKGVMAGVPISAFLANYYLKEMDHYFEQNHIIYARYADDIIVFDESYEKILKHQKYIVSYLTKMNLEINKQKEYFYNPKEPFEFLGFSYQNGMIDLSFNTIKKIKGKIRRTARGLRRWKLRKRATDEVTLKAMNRKFNRKFFGNNETDLTWKYWFFPVINTSDSLKVIDQYMQDWQRFIVTGKHNKKNLQKVPYQVLKDCHYRSLVFEFYKERNQKAKSHTNI